MEICENPDILRVIWFGLEIIDIVKIIIPIALIVLGIIDFSKAVITSDENVQKKTGKLFMKRIIYAVLVFAVPWIIEVLIITLGNLAVLDSNEVNFTDCLENANGDKIAELEKIEENETKELKCWHCSSDVQLYQWGTSANSPDCHGGWYEFETIKLEENCNFEYVEELDNKEDEILIDNEVENNNDDTGILIGRKYNDLTDAQLKGIARLCQQEQGTAIGAAAEASLMANQFELFGSNYGQGGDGLFNYVGNSGWFANAKKYMSMTDSLRDDVYTAVYEVLILGKRTLPFYIDEHDCIKCYSGFDVVKIMTDGNIISNEDELQDHSNYIQDSTVIYNRYGSVYTFYTFPTEHSDPFGYTTNAKKKYDSLTK